MAIKPINEALADFQSDLDAVQTGSTTNLGALNDVADELSEFSDDLDTVKADAATHLATLTGIINALVTAETITDEFDAVLADLNNNDTALQALTVPDLAAVIEDIEEIDTDAQGLRVPSVPNGVQYNNVVLD